MKLPIYIIKKDLIMFKSEASKVKWYKNCLKYLNYIVVIPLRYEGLQILPMF